MRVHDQRYAELIAAAFDWLDVAGPGLRARLERVHFHCGLDPIFTGLHAEEASKDGRSLRTTAHAGEYRGHPTVVLFEEELHPPPVNPRWGQHSLTWNRYVVAHELGHALHYQVTLSPGRRWWESSWFPRPVSKYARDGGQGYYERFSEAFAYFVMTQAGRGGWLLERQPGRDRSPAAPLGERERTVDPSWLPAYDPQTWALLEQLAATGP